MIDQGGYPRQVLYLLTEKIPNARGVNRKQRALGPIVKLVAR